VVPEVHLILGDQVGGDDGAGVRVVAELRVEGLGLAEGGRGRRGRRGGRLSSVLWGSLDRVLRLRQSTMKQVTAENAKRCE
jgi:hypothetical protein